MRMLVLTEGGKSSGFGHLMRCAALAEVFKKKFGHEGQVKFVLKADKRSSVFLRMRGIEFIDKDWLKDFSFVSSSAGQSDIVFIDSHVAEKEVYDILSRSPRAKVCAIDDFNRMAYPVDIVINPSVSGEKLNYQPRKGVRYLTGGEFVILREEYARVSRKKINKKAEKILIAFGGMDHVALISGITDRLIKEPGLEVVGLRPDKKVVSAPEFIDLCLECDIAVSGGGQTIYELLRIGMPVVGVRLFDNQAVNLGSLASSGLIEYAGDSDEAVIVDRVIDCVRKLLPAETREGFSSKGRKLIDGRGAERIIDFLTG